MLTTRMKRDDFGCNRKALFEFLQNGTTFQLDTNGWLPKTQIHLDNQSTVDIFYNGALLNNICKYNSLMHIHCNAGVAATNMGGDLPGYGQCGTIPMVLQTFSLLLV